MVVMCACACALRPTMEPLHRRTSDPEWAGGRATWLHTSQRGLVLRALLDSPHTRVLLAARPPLP
jgi:hypothetical protein